jgi:transposase-like protein
MTTSRTAKEAIRLSKKRRTDGIQRVFPFLPAPSEKRKHADRCDIVAVGRRRDGGTRYWCLMHNADATAKYGVPAAKCKYADVPTITSSESRRINVDAYPGGVACWGAVPPVYDTTALPLDRGIHLHARLQPRGRKEIDATYRRVILIGKNLPTAGVEISELDAIYYMVTSVFGYQMRHIVCTECGHAHLDKDWFSVHPHRRHLCAGCGKHFRDSETAIGNPIAGVRKALACERHVVKSANRPLSIKQSDYKGGIQIWGSNPALVWTSHEHEEEGIHIHAFRYDGDDDPLDDTFSEVIVDGVELDPVMVRTLMAQSALPHLKGRIGSHDCPKCGQSHFARDEAAYTAMVEHRCENCGRQFPSHGRLRKSIGNPLVGILESLSLGAPRKPQVHEMGLIPETL